MSAYSHKRTFDVLRLESSLYRVSLGVFRPDQVSAGLQFFRFLRPSHLTERRGVVLQARGHVSSQQGADAQPGI